MTTNEKVSTQKESRVLLEKLERVIDLEGMKPGDRFFATASGLRCGPDGGASLPALSYLVPREFIFGSFSVGDVVVVTCMDADTGTLTTINYPQTFISLSRRQCLERSMDICKEMMDQSSTMLERLMEMDEEEVPSMVEDEDV